MLRERNYQDELRNAPRDAELPGVGVIVTNDPHRQHASDDRFIVTRHAPMIAVFWGLAANLSGAESEAWSCLHLFADAVEEFLPVDDIIVLCEEGLRAAQRELELRIRELVPET